MRHRIDIGPVPHWVDRDRLIGDGEWEVEDGDGGVYVGGWLETEPAADLAVRLRKLWLDGREVEVGVRPAPKRRFMREASTRAARARRDGSVGFSRVGAHVDDIGKISLTPEEIAQALGARYAGQRVFDACCGAGGDTIGFARAGCRVVAVDRDAARLADARHNARLYGVEDTIRFVHADALDALGDTPWDVLYVDPPWGGVAWPREGMGVDALPPLAALLARFRSGAARVFVAKLPPSFRVSEIAGADVEAVFGVGAGDRQRIKFLRVTLRAT